MSSPRPSPLAFRLYHEVIAERAIGDVVVHYLVPLLP